MRYFFTAIIGFSFMLSGAVAAPLWLERQVIPDVELLDPVFAVHAETEGAVVDHSAWADFLARRLQAGTDGVNRLDYAGTASDRTIVEDYIAQLEATDTRTLTQPEQLAFWINLYNAATVRLVSDHYPTDSIRDINRPWKQSVATVNGIALSLNDIEHKIIRAVFDEPRIHYAVNCAAIGCPNLGPRPYIGAEIDEMLDAAALAYVNDPRGVRIEDDDVVVSKIYGWFKEDFGDSEEAILDHIRAYASPDLLSALDGVDDIDDYEYDWALNDAAQE